MILVRHGESEFNATFNRTRIDPGIPDPRLTPEGRRQASAAAEALRRLRVERMVVSPYSRTLETAAIIAKRLDLPATIEPLVRERAVFVCDIGTSTGKLARVWPRYRFDHLEERWWSALGESEAELLERCARFRAATEQEDWGRVVVVTHWGFIRGLTGRDAGNCELIRFNSVHRVAATPITPLESPGSCGIEQSGDP